MMFVGSIIRLYVHYNDNFDTSYYSRGKYFIPYTLKTAPMKLCLSGTPVEAPQIRANDPVDVATKKVASIFGEEYSSILLIYRGQLLSRLKRLDDYLFYLV